VQGVARPRSAGAVEVLVTLAGQVLVPDGTGALYWPSERTLLVSDLHLGKGAAFARRGVMLPPYDTRQTLERLSAVLSRYDASTVISLGDSFQDARACTEVSADDLALLARLQRGRAWVWVRGNHDREAAIAGGEVVDEIVVSGLTLRHEPVAAPGSCEIAGHLHPAAKVALEGGTLRRACFVSDGNRLVMPAFGTFTGGLNVLSAPFAGLFAARVLVHLISNGQVYPVAARRLRPD